MVKDNGFMDDMTKAGFELSPAIGQEVQDSGGAGDEARCALSADDPGHDSRQGKPAKK